MQMNNIPFVSGDKLKGNRMLNSKSEKLLVTTKLAYLILIIIYQKYLKKLIKKFMF